MNTVFLDIDGVLQPYNSKERFKHINENLKEELSQKYGIDYKIYDIYDICAVYYDWKEDAIKNLKNILDSTESKIIVSSEWRSKKYPNKMKDFLRILNLDKYWYSDTTINSEIGLYMENRRSLEISEAILNNDIYNYVILDDMRELINFFPNNFVRTYNYLTIENMNEAIKILKR